MAKQLAKNYKFKELKTYTSRDWLVQQKKYRQVFIDVDTDWVYGELSIYNLLFDEEEWTCKMKFEGYKKKEGGKDEQLFSYENEQTIKTDQNIYYYRDGWGNKDKTYWKKGEYYWVAYIDGEKVATSSFYVEDQGLVTKNDNPYFTINNIKFFPGGYNVPAFSDRKYYTQFIGPETEYLYSEINIDNKLDKPWWCELQLNYYDDAGRLKGLSTELVKVTDSTASIDFGWGNASKNTWSPGEYTLEVIFMEVLIAVVPFTIGDTWIEGEPEVSAVSVHGGVLTQEQKMDEKSLEELIVELNSLIGLSEIKTQVTDYIDYLKFEQIRKDKGLQAQDKINLHAVLTGNPGTGKTTVAKKLGKIYKAMGLLTRGHVHEVDRADLVGEYIGQTAPKVKKEIEKARGGILFIDEAYSLHREDTKNDFGQEVIEILLKEMSDGPGNIAIVAAGYPEEMSGFINSNPGLKSRFAHYFKFPDYLPTELMDIAELGLKSRALEMEEDAKGYLFTKLTQAFRGRDKSFGNARYVLSIVDEAKMNMALRLVKRKDTEQLDDTILSTINLEDVQKIFLSNQQKNLSLQIDQALLREALDELESLIGMENIKTEVQDLVKLVKYYREIGKDVLNQFVLHTVFTGNPGTGKTTVARIFAKLFKALAIIERGHLVECDRDDLVSGYTGQTAIKTTQTIDRAMGGVLFIDEAYSLVQGANDNYGMEAINTLLKRMEDDSKEFIVIAAGYPDNMEQFLKTNPGLKSRFEKTMNFEDYTPEEMLSIADMMFKKEDLIIDESARQEVYNYLKAIHANRDKYFGNAREVRKMVQEVVRDHNLRMADLSSDQRSMEMITTITPEDLDHIRKQEKLDQNDGGRPLGFQIGR